MFKSCNDLGVTKNIYLKTDAILFNDLLVTLNCIDREKECSFSPVFGITNGK